MISKINQNTLKALNDLYLYLVLYGWLIEEALK